jgi:hypothetical protein
VTKNSSREKGQEFDSTQENFGKYKNTKKSIYKNITKGAIFFTRKPINRINDLQVIVVQEFNLLVLTGQTQVGQFDSPMRQNDLFKESSQTHMS